MGNKRMWVAALAAVAVTAAITVVAAPDGQAATAPVAAAPVASSGPGGPVLVIGDATNLYSGYYGEILKAEGLNYYRFVDLSTVTASVLSGYDVAVLGDVALTDAQVSMLTSWVTGGGNLIAMSPDKKLAGLLGLTDAGTTLSEAWLRISTSSGPGAGIVGTSIQYHGTADRYTLNGATAVATLYSNATTATANPAVTTRTVGTQGGHAAAFTYDLARSVVLTRQGNVAWAGQQRDNTDGYEAAEMFMGTGGAPDWNSLSNALIPIADEQQRLLANMILQLNQARRPLPRFWYFPRSVKAVIVMTGDDHAHNGTAGRFDQYDAASPSGCNVANWECIRASSYMYPNTPITDAKAQALNAKGFEIALHPSTLCRPWTSATALADSFANQLAEFRAAYPSVPDPVSTRTHCVEWDDWATEAKVELNLGMRLDTNYYYYPTSWVQDRPGYFNGTGEIMRFADTDGSVIDVYQATTQMTDESGQSYPYTVDTLLDGAYGPQGYYAALTANIHTDNANSAASDAILASAKARGVPIVSGRQMLTWLDARDAASYQSIAWSGGNLTFTVAGGANGLTGMLPLSTATGSLTSITRGTTTVPFTTQVIKGMTYAFFTAATGSYTATYGADTTAPTVTSTTPTDGATNVSPSDPISVQFSEPMTASTVSTSTIELRNGANALVGRTVAYNSGTNTAVVTPSATLATGATYTVSVLGGSSGVKDAAGNAMSASTLR